MTKDQWLEVLKGLHILYQRQIASDVTAYIGLEKQKDGLQKWFGKSGLSQFFCIWVYDETNKECMTLKLLHLESC